MKGSETTAEMRSQIAIFRHRLDIHWLCLMVVWCDAIRVFRNLFSEADNVWFSATTIYNRQLIPDEGISISVFEFNLRLSSPQLFLNWKNGGNFRIVGVLCNVASELLFDVYGRWCGKKFGIILPCGNWSRERNQKTE